MEIRTATPAEFDDVMAVERAAFGQDDEAELVEALLGDPSAQPSLSLLAIEDGRAIGHVLFTNAQLENATRSVSAVILAPLAVVPEAQGRGVGGRLIEVGIERLERSGTDLVFVLGDPGYYTRHGFAPAMPHGLAAPYDVSPEEAWMVQALRPGLLGTVKGPLRCADVMDRPEYWRE
jgi:putative acetyltransferase